jgi:hypothetical protein
MTKDFRPISLTNFLLKILERLVDMFLKTGPLLKHPLAASQYAYREGSSTETALHHQVCRVEKHLEAKKIRYCGLFLYIERAFCSTSNITIKQAMIRYEIPEVFVGWTENMLAGNVHENHSCSRKIGTDAKFFWQVVSPTL